MAQSDKTKAHIRYRDSSGNIVPGVTTVVGLLAKPQLIKWANNLGLQGIDSSKYVDAMADIGTLAHYLIMCHLKDEEPDTSDYSPNQVESANNCLASYLAWEKHHKIVPKIIETPLISDALRVGGTPDLYCLLDGVPTLVDYKTGRSLYPEYSYQLAGYRAILEEKGNSVEQCILIRVGRDEGEGFEEKIIKNTNIDYSIFSCCLSIYHLQKQGKEEEKMARKLRADKDIRELWPNG